MHVRLAFCLTNIILMLQNGSKRITSIKEIAKLAGYSIATVSNTLNDKGRIRTEVRQHILDICQKHGYIPNSAGRNLRRQKNETIGLMFYPSSSAIFRNVYYAEIMEALEFELERAGYDLLLSGHDSSIDPNVSPRFLRQGKVDGIILLGRFPRKRVVDLNDYGIPLVQLDGFRELLKVDYVTSDGYSASEQIVDHLVKLKHRRIAFVAYNHEDTNANQREAGFLAAVGKHHLSFAECKNIRDIGNTTEAYEMIKLMLESETPPTAIVAVNDTLAVELVDLLQKDGYSVPQDVSVFGFNDDADSKKSNPQISTVRIDKIKLAQIGAKMIIDRIESPDLPHQKASLPTELIHRDSVAIAKS